MTAAEYDKASRANADLALSAQAASINRIPQWRGEAMTIKEYEERFLKPASERLREELLEQWGKDAAHFGWASKPRPWWRRLWPW